MNKQRGYSLIEVAIVLVVISLLGGAFTAGYSLYRERAAFFSADRASTLNELIALGKGNVHGPKTDPETDIAAAPVETPPSVDDTPLTVEEEQDIERLPWWQQRFARWRIFWRRWFS